MPVHTARENMWLLGFIELEQKNHIKLLKMMRMEIFWKFGSKIFTNNTAMTFQTEHIFSILVAAILKVANNYVLWLYM